MIGEKIMNVGDDVTINGVIAEVYDDDSVLVEFKSGEVFRIWQSDLNTIRPKIEIPKKDERRGN
jgi:hypothetical protein